MNYFVVTLRHGPRWDPTRSLREQEGWDAHAAFMDELAAEGFIVLGGPFRDGALHIVNAGSAEEVERRFAGDPWQPAGLLYTESIEPWEILLVAPR